MTPDEVNRGVTFIKVGDVFDRTYTQRLHMLRKRCWYPGILTVAPGDIKATNDRVVEHTCSTFPGMSGGPGVELERPYILHFVHVSGTPAREDNHNLGISVNHPVSAKQLTTMLLVLQRT